MNKTININLAGIFYHIDEDAFSRLQLYLEAVRKSLSSTPGKDEIMNDIEARIAELFSEKIKHDRQVISIREVDEVISVMGQPEDFVLDQDVYSDEPAPVQQEGKKLFRDTEDAYVGGVSSGLGHYLGMRPIWIRLAWILFTIFSTGAFILVYLALWIFLPEAKTTADKLAMRGEPVTIGNIEKKIREGFDNVSDKVKDVDYQKYGYHARSGASSAATAVGKITSFLLNLVVKFVGILLLLISGSILILLFIGLFSIGTFGVIEAPWTDYVELAGPGVENIWIISLFTFFGIGIPFFFLFTLGLKILVQNLKSTGRTTKRVLLGLWIISVLGLIFFGIKQATETAFDAETVVNQVLPVGVNDTIYLNMKGNPNFNTTPYQSEDFNLSFDENNQEVIWSQDISLSIRPTEDSLGRIEVIKIAEGKTRETARERAENIDYEVDYSGTTLNLAGQLTTARENKYRDQQVRIKVFLPIGTVLYAQENVDSFHSSSEYFDQVLRSGQEEQFLLIKRDGATCLSCPAEETDPWPEDPAPEEVDSGAKSPPLDSESI